MTAKCATIEALDDYCKIYEKLNLKQRDRDVFFYVLRKYTTNSLETMTASIIKK